jgi:hypothetical protein
VRSPISGSCPPPLSGRALRDTGRLHQPRHPLSPHPDPMREPQLGLDPRRPIHPPAVLMNLLDPLGQKRSRTRRSQNSDAAVGWSPTQSSGSRRRAARSERQRGCCPAPESSAQGARDGCAAASRDCAVFVRERPQTPRWAPSSADSSGDSVTVLRAGEDDGVAGQP